MGARGRREQERRLRGWCPSSSERAHPRERRSIGRLDRCGDEAPGEMGFERRDDARARARVYGGPKLAASFEALAAVAESNLSVVLVGETGTGKEVFARTLHALSGRTGKLVAVNCAAIPRHLAESELFGYRKGAFTGADRHHAGYLREADGGTLLLDEITDLDMAIQAKLLRALEERAVVSLGDTRAQPIDLRGRCSQSAVTARRRGDWPISCRPVGSSVRRGAIPSAAAPPPRRDRRHSFSSPCPGKRGVRGDH